MVKGNSNEWISDAKDICITSAVKRRVDDNFFSYENLNTCNELSTNVMLLAAKSSNFV